MWLEGDLGNKENVSGLKEKRFMLLFLKGGNDQLSAPIEQEERRYLKEGSIIFGEEPLS